jgi:outer membrane biosynthesis protein TonB
MTTVHRRLAAAATTTVLSLGLLAGCGGEEDPLAPLYETLGQIDDSIVAGEYDRARDQVADLLDQVSQARTDGDMTKPDATRIREAAKELRARLADQQDEADEPTETPTTSAPTTEGDGGSSDEPTQDEPSDEPTEEPSDAPTEPKPTKPKPTKPAPTPDEPDPTTPADPGDGGDSGTSGADPGDEG